MEARSLQHGVSQVELNDSLRALFDSPFAFVSVTAATEAANVRRFTLQVKDRIMVDWRSVFHVYAALALTDRGEPQNAQTVSVVTGTVVQEIMADGAWIFQTDSAGKVVLDVTIVGAATRYVPTYVVGQPRSSSGFVWA